MIDTIKKLVESGNYRYTIHGFERCIEREISPSEAEIDLRIEGKLYLVTNVSYEECQFCGEKVINPELSKILHRKIQKKEFVERSVRIPVLDGTYA